MFKQNFIIGNTPMIKINYKYKGQSKQIFAKLEYYNLTGSIKDRVVFYMINNAKANGILKEKMPLIEATSGNTGISLSALGAYYKHPVYIYMPDWVSKERMQLMKSYGANVFLISKEDGGFLKCLEEAKKLAQKINGLFTNQFSNKDNFLAHYETTGKEILNQISEPINGFVSGVGTGGTLMGIGQKLKEKYPNLIVTAIEPDKMPLISQGKILDQHKIEGIGDDFIPDLIDKNKINKILLINDDDAINMSRKLSKELGIGVGISSGANLLGGILLENDIHGNIVTIFPDDNKKYLSTELTNEIDLNPNFISNKVELLNIDFT